MNEKRMTPEALAEIRERAERATPGAWNLKKDGRYEDHDECRIELPDDDIELCRYENGEFIAHAREDVPALIAEIARLTTENASLRAELEAAKNDLAHECYTCKHFRDNDGKCPLWGTKCRELGWKAFLGLVDAPPYEWEWRGICPANTPALGATDETRGGGE